MPGVWAAPEQTPGTGAESCLPRRGEIFSAAVQERLKEQHCYFAVISNNNSETAAARHISKSCCHRPKLQRRRNRSGKRIEIEIEIEMGAESRAGQEASRGVLGWGCGTGALCSGPSPDFLQPRNGDVKIIKAEEKSVFSVLSLDRR